MIHVSDQLLEESKENQNYYVVAEVTLADGTHLSLQKEDFFLDGNGIVDSADSSDFPIGVAIEKTATLSLVNDENQFSGYSFNRAIFVIYMNLELSDGKVETFKRGSFIVCKKPAIDEEVNLTLLDYMCRTDRDYDTNITFPCTAGELLRDSCRSCGIVLGDAAFKNDDFRIMKKPTGTTHRAVIGMIAALAGGNARLDENDMLRIVTYQKINKDNFSGIELIGVDDVQTDVDLIAVTGVKYTADKQDYVYGTDGYMINLKNNQLLSGNEQDGVNRIGEILTGFEILPFSASAVPMGYVTFGDAVKFEDYRGNTYYSYATDVDFTFADSTGFSCRAKSIENQNAMYPSESRVLVEQAKREILENMSAYDAKLKQLNDMAANTLGFYSTQETLADGSVITYRHDKPTLAESKIIYKTGIDGFFLSIDGGETWKSGFDANGDAVLNILYAIGIQGEWINTRGLTAKDNDGNITFRVNADTGEVEINAESMKIQGKGVDKIAQEKVIEEMQNTPGNLLKGYYLDEDSIEKYWDVKGEYTCGVADPAGGNRALKIKMTGSSVGLFAKMDSNNPIKKTGNYIGTVWVKANSSTFVNIVVNGKSIGQQSVSSTWKRISFFHEATEIPSENAFYISINGGANYELYIYAPEMNYAYTTVQVFNMLTNNGALKGIYMKNRELYISFSYAQGGILTLGGKNNGYGKLEILDTYGRKRLVSDEDTLYLYSSYTNENNWNGVVIDIGTGQISLERKVNGSRYIDVIPLITSLNSGKLCWDAEFNELTTRGENNFYGNLFARGNSSFMKAPKFYNITRVTSGSPLVFYSDGATMAYTSASSMRYKTISKSITEADLENVYKIKTVWARYKDDYLDASDERYGKEMPMFLAEDIDRRFPLAVDHDEKGRAENWNYRIMIPLMFAMLKNDHSKITELQAENQELRKEMQKIRNELTEIRKYIS